MNCLHFASPAGATGGLEGWGLGGYIKKTIKITKWTQRQPRWCQNRVKINANWVLGAKMVSGRLQERSRLEFRPPLERFWAPLGIPKLTQNLTFDEKLRSRSGGFIDFCNACRCGYNFHRFLVDFWAKKRCCFVCFCLGPLTFCATWRPSQNTAICISKATFSFFRIYHFF